MRRLKRTRGAALVFAMLIMALVATASAGMQWKQWREMEVEATERLRVQSDWLLTGSLDWARLLLREDARISKIDHLGEPWALALQNVNYLNFLGGEQQTRSADGSPTPSPIITFSLQITDMQSRLNAANLAGLGQVSKSSLRAFERLFELLALPPTELAKLVENMRLASDLGAEGIARKRSPLAPYRTQELSSMGLSHATLTLLEPYVTVLPARTAVNVNIATSEVLYSVFDGITLADARRLIREREKSPLNTLADAARVLRRTDGIMKDNTVISVGSRYFEVRTQLRQEHAVSQITVLVQRDGLDVMVMQRERGTDTIF